MVAVANGVFGTYLAKQCRGQAQEISGDRGSSVVPTVLKLGLKTLFHLGIAGSIGCLSDELAGASGILCLQPSATRGNNRSRVSPQ